MRTRLLLLILLLTAFAALRGRRAAGADVLEIPPGAPLLEIVGPITPQLSYPGIVLFQQILLSQPRELYILINSPGGVVFVSDILVSLIEAAKSRGTEVICVSPVMAFSAAFIIYSHCSTRYAFSHTMLLFHPVRAMVLEPLRAPEAAALAEDLGTVDSSVLEYFCDTMVRSLAACEKLRQAYYGEKTWSGKTIQTLVSPGWINIVTDVRGIPAPFKLIPGETKGGTP